MNKLFRLTFAKIITLVLIAMAVEIFDAAYFLRSIETLCILFPMCSSIVLLIACEIYTDQLFILNCKTYLERDRMLAKAYSIDIHLRSQDLKTRYNACIHASASLQYDCSAVLPVFKI